ncbi:DUF3846 domain-containing protein [Vibrio tritonius]|uniref:DUF3846 domain-containing protein n=1 Tax=Vibrio tritonius TaxID=1435069 RepID=UPI00315C5595
MLSNQSKPDTITCLKLYLDPVIDMVKLETIHLTDCTPNYGECDCDDDALSKQCQEMREHIGCRHYDMLQIRMSNNECVDIWFDDEGLLKPNDRVLKTKVVTYPQPLFGTLLISGSGISTGYITDVPKSVRANLSLLISEFFMTKIN